jgi:DNA-binding PadR family transcriptional regulator
LCAFSGELTIEGNQKEERGHSHGHSIGHRHRRPFQRGDFKYILLRHLKEKPSYGYEIIRAIEERFHSFYTPSPGSVYPTLQMLEEMGYVSTTEKEGKKVYSITEEGSKFLEDEKESEARISKQLKKWWNPENTDDIISTMREFEKLTGLVRDKVRNADADKLSHMRQVLSHAYQEISEE